MANAIASRFERIMALVDAWADEHADRERFAERYTKAIAEVEFVLGEKEYSDWDDEMVADAGIAAWEMVSKSGQSDN